MPVLDIVDDLGASFVEALDGRTPPELLKTAEWKEPYEALDRDFALILVDSEGKEHRKYACHDAGNTAMSMFYLARATSALSPTAIKVAAANLSRIAQEQGLDVPEPIAKLASVELLSDKDVLDERRVIYRAQPQKRASVKLAGFGLLADIERRWPDLEPHEKRAAALQLVDECATVPLSIPDHIHRYTGDELSEKFAAHMKQRQHYSGGGPLMEEYARLAKVAGVLGADQTLQVLYELDARAGLRWDGGHRYGEKIADPFLCVYGTEKQAMWSWSHGGDNINQAQLIAFATNPESANVFKMTFTDGLWLRFVKDPVSTFKGMPVEQQVLLSRMARQV